MPILTVRHATTYRYRRPVAFGEHRLMLRPREGFDQRLLDWRLEVSPAAEVRWLADLHGNAVGVARFARRAATLRIESFATLAHDPLIPMPCGDERPGPDGRFAYAAADLPDLLTSLAPAHADADGSVGAWARGFVGAGDGSAVALLSAMTHAVRGGFGYARRCDGLIQPPAQTLARRAGTCRDFAVLMIEAVRSLGFAARFVSGYVHSPARPKAGEPRQGGGATHAWVQVYLPSCGWAEFDPTNGIVGGTDLIKAAVAPDPSQVVPLAGAWEGEAEDFLSMEVEVDVELAEPERALQTVRRPALRAA